MDTNRAEIGAEKQSTTSSSDPAASASEALLIESSGVSRRSLLSRAGTAAIAAGGLLAGSNAAVAQKNLQHKKHQKRERCRPAAPRPIPGFDPDLESFGIFEHLFLPVQGREPSTIFDFSGRVAIMDLIGDGIRCVDGVEEPAAFRADLRFFDGNYIGLDGRRHQNTFGFI